VQTARRLVARRMGTPAAAGPPEGAAPTAARQGKAT
jgi:hypothetical protein